MEVAADWAKIIFWGTPELLEKMVPHLDSSSILSLTEVNTEVCSVILKVLESDSVWAELIKRTCREHFYYEAGPISNLGKILSKMANLQKKDLELALLHLLVARCSPNAYDAPCVFICKIKVSCPCNTSHTVSDLVFIHLENVESAIGSTEQNVEEVAISHFSDKDPIFSALGSRMQRQEHMIRVWDMDSLSCKSLAGVKTASIFLNKTVRINWVGTGGFPGHVSVEGVIGEEEWTLSLIHI